MFIMNTHIIYHTTPSLIMHELWLIITHYLRASLLEPWLSSKEVKCSIGELHKISEAVYYTTHRICE